MLTALVTGADKGLGAAFVNYLANNDYLVFAGLYASKDTFGLTPNVVPVSLDVSEDSSLLTAYNLVRSQTNTIDIIINNAGINKDSATANRKEKVSTLGSLERKLLLRMYDINALSPLLVLQVFLPLLTNDPSFVINISSSRSVVGDKHNSSVANYGYRASKAALNMITYCATFDLPANVKTFAVHPGWLKTDMNAEGYDDPLVQAEKIIAITKKWKNSFNGQFLNFDGTIYS